MRSCDTNVLAYFYDPSSPAHGPATKYLEEQADRGDFVLCDLMLVELYVLLRNSAVFTKACTAEEAVAQIRGLIANPRWRVVHYPGKLVMDLVWQDAQREGIGRRAIYDARVARTLRHHGVREFATRNVKDFERFGFERVFNPIDAA